MCRGFLRSVRRCSRCGLCFRVRLLCGWPSFPGVGGDYKLGLLRWQWCTFSNIGLCFYLLSFYLWLLRAFLVQFFFLLVNKFVNLLAVFCYCVYLGKTLSQYLLDFNLYFIFILFFVIFIYFHILRTVVSSAPMWQYSRSRLFYFTLCYLFCCYILSG